MFTTKQIAHFAMAVATGAGVFAAEATNISGNPWVDAGCYAALAFLAAMGVGVARRAQAE